MASLYVDGTCFNYGSYSNGGYAFLNSTDTSDDNNTNLIYRNAKSFSSSNTISFDDGSISLGNLIEVGSYINQFAFAPGWTYYRRTYHFSNCIIGIDKAIEDDDSTNIFYGYQVVSKIYTDCCITKCCEPGKYYDDVSIALSKS